MDIDALQAHGRRDSVHRLTHMAMLMVLPGINVADIAKLRKDSFYTVGVRCPMHSNTGDAHH